MAATAMGAAPPNNKPVIFDPYQGAAGATQGAGTGALCTGIGYGLNVNMAAIGPNFTDDVQPKLHRIGQAWTAAYICAFGNGIARDDAAGKAAPMKVVTAAADVAVGGVIETGFTNNTGAILKAGSSTFGSGAIVAAAPKVAEEPAPAPTKTAAPAAPAPTKK